jgi:tetratricopeptide (TPR) repeat protein
MVTSARRGLVLGVLVGIGAVGPLPAQTPEDIFHRGNAAYEEGRYADAVEAYRSLLRYDVRDATVEYNLGNAEFRAGNLGRAILHYERARRLDPLDPDIRANLEFARAHCLDRVEEPEVAAIVRGLRAAQDRAGPDRQAWVVVGLVWALGAVLSLGLARPGGFTAAHGWALAGLLLVLGATAGSWYATLERSEGTRVAVVLEDAAEVLAGPGRNNSTLFTVHEGLALRIRSEREEWLQVSLPNGLNGWIAREAIEEV